MKKATIYNFSRVCRAHTKKCENCPMSADNNGADELCLNLVTKYPDKANEIILKWCEEHPVKTRLSELQKIIPKIILDSSEEYADICPSDIDEDFNCKRLCDNYAECADCQKEYWLAEVEEWHGTFGV